jgi:hypothetical protein
MNASLWIALFLVVALAIYILGIHFTEYNTKSWHWWATFGNYLRIASYLFFVINLVYLFFALINYKAP